MGPQPPTLAGVAVLLFSSGRRRFRTGHQHAINRLILPGISRNRHRARLIRYGSFGFTTIVGGRTAAFPLTAEGPSGAIHISGGRLAAAPAVYRATNVFPSLCRRGASGVPVGCWRDTAMVRKGQPGRGGRAVGQSDYSGMRRTPAASL